MPFRAGSSLALAVALAGCGGGGSPPGDAPPERGVAIPDGGVAAGHGAGDLRVRVPERDATPPLAQLRLDPGGGAPAVVHRSPVRAGHGPAVALARPEVRATAVIRDPDGGTGRIRLTVRWVADCGGERRVRTVHLPPSQIERIRIAPGVLAPVERRRSGRVRLPRGCDGDGRGVRGRHERLGPRELQRSRALQRGSRGDRIRYALSPRPSRSRSSLNAGSSPLSSFTRSSR